MSEETSRPFDRYTVPISPSLFDLIRNGKQNNYSISTSEHLPQDRQTFKNMPESMENKLKNVVVGDSLIFVCYPGSLKNLPKEKRVEYIGEIEKKIDDIIKIPKGELPMKIFYFKAEKL